MGASWQTDDQKAFFEQHLASYTRNLDEGMLKGFWPTIADKWFKRWLVGVAPPELVTKKGSVAKAENALRTKMMEVSVTQLHSVSTRAYLFSRRLSGPSRARVSTTLSGSIETSISKTVARE